MKRLIHKVGHISNTDGMEFYEGVRQMVEEWQSEGYYAEIQYQTAVQPNGVAVFSALLLGYK